MTGFREQGSGIPLMLLHGISSGAASWHKQMALKGFRVLAWDMPGYGESPMLTVAGECGGLRRCTGGVLDRAGVWQAVLVGHSWEPWSPAPLRRSSRPGRHLVLADAARATAGRTRREQLA
ncbi:MAG: alpha/beta fold hydrolase [Enterobacter hormaechei]